MQMMIFTLGRADLGRQCQKQAKRRGRLAQGGAASFARQNNRLHSLYKNAGNLSIHAAILRF